MRSDRHIFEHQPKEEAVEALFAGFQRELQAGLAPASSFQVFADGDLDRAQRYIGPADLSQEGSDSDFETDMDDASSTASRPPAKPLGSSCSAK